MKPEINNENKAKLFALYYGESVLMSKHYESPIPNTGASIDYLSADDYTSYYLQLKPLSSIIDEDAIEVAKIYGLNQLSIRSKSQFGVKDFGSKYGEITLYNDLSFGGGSKSYFEADYFRKDIVIDYLRLKGYAVPWMGLSVEEMVEAGWIKLLSK